MSTPTPDQATERSDAPAVAKAPMERYLGWLRQNWTVVVGGVGLLAAVQRAFTMAFYRRFGVSTDEVGIGSIRSSIEGVITFVLPYVVLNIAVFEWSTRLTRLWFARQRQSAGRLAGAFRGDRRATMAFFGVRLAIIATVVAALIAGVTLDNRWIYAGAGAVYALAMVASSIERPHGLDTGNQAPAAPIKPRRTVIGFTVALSLLFFVVAPTVHSIRDSTAALEGRSVSGFPVVAWSAQPASLTWLGNPPDDLVDIGDHCLMYLGHADGVTVFYDVDDRRPLRIPTSAIAVVSGRGANTECLAP